MRISVIEASGSVRMKTGYSRKKDSTGGRCRRWKTWDGSKGSVLKMVIMVKEAVDRCPVTCPILAVILMIDEEGYLCEA